MAHYKYERLSPQDNDFLHWESENLPMHGAAVQIFDAGPLATEGGGIDFAAIYRGIEGILHEIPRYREKLAWLPRSGDAIWIDDPQFNLAYHLRHTALPRPGSDQQLKQLAARILERPLDRSRPLWEIWVVEGLEGGRFATIGKTHHCMMDGATGVDVAQHLYSTSPEVSVREPHRYVPRPPPSSAELRRDEWLHRARLPLHAVANLRDFARGAENVTTEIFGRVRALAQMAMMQVNPTSDTPLNGPVGPHRSIDWLNLPLADIKAVRKALDCTVNDVVLAIVTGAVRDFLIQRRTDPTGLEFRVATPVSMRRPGEEHSGGNRVSTWILPLPIGEPDPCKQIEAIHTATEEAKESHQAAAIEMVEAFQEFVRVDLQALSIGTQNLYVTNVPGPQFPLYLLGAELQGLYIQAPLLTNVGLVVAVMSYNGRVCCSFTSDYDRIPDVADFGEMIRGSFERLVAAAEVQLES
jgi:WS/DGAT/MGAT family acyltransferase